MLCSILFSQKKGGGGGGGVGCIYAFTVKTQMKFWSPGRSDSEGCMNNESYKAKAIKSPYEQ